MKKYFTLALSLLTGLVLGQTISGVTPSVAHPLQTLEVTITGNSTNFQSGNESARLVLYKQGSNAPQYFTANTTDATSNTSMNASFDLPADIYVYDVEVYNETDGWLFLDDGVVIQKSDYQLDKTEGELNSSLTVSITGSNTTLTQGISNVKLYQNGTGTTEIVGENVSVSNDNIMTADFNIPTNAVIGSYHLTVVTAQNYSKTEFNVFNVIVGESGLTTLSHVWPNQVKEDESYVFYLIGSNFKENTIESVEFVLGNYKISKSDVVVLNSDSVEVSIDIPKDSPLGSYDINIYTGDGSGVISKLGALTVLNNSKNDGKIIDVTPRFIDQGENLTVTITGNSNSKFSDGVGSLTLYKGISQGTQATCSFASNVSVVNDTEVEFDLSVADPCESGYLSFNLYSNAFGNDFVSSAVFINPITVGPGTFLGTIGDDNKSVSQTYTIMLFDKSTNELVKMTSNDGYGEFTFSNIPEGTYYFEIEGKENAGNVKEFEISSLGEVTHHLSIEILPEDQQMVTGAKSVQQKLASIYPNPTSDVIHLTFENSNQTLKKVLLFDLLGNTVFEASLPIGQIQTQFNLNDLPDGMYLIQFSGDEHSEIHQIIKK